MKRLAAFLLVVALTGCGKNDALSKGITLRNSLLDAAGCSFTAEITADYGDAVQRFTLSARSDASGAVQFQVLEPSSISEISGKLEAKGGELRFDGTALAFPLLADDQLSPVSAPWVLVRTLRSGILSSAGEEKEHTRLTYQDSFDGEELVVDLWLDQADAPVQADILYDDRRILTLSIKDFHILPS